MIIKSLCVAAAFLTVVVVSQGDVDFSQDLATVCDHKKTEHPTLLISTLDGKLTAIQLSETLPIVWEHHLDNPLLSTTMTPQENIHFIPALDGTLFYYNTTTKTVQKNSNIDNLDIMLNSKPGPDQQSRFIGGKTTSTLGIEPDSGKILYSCNMDDCKKFNDSKIEEETLLAVTVERRTCRVIDLKGGNERWNLTVATVDMQYIGSKHGASCLPPDLGIQLFFNPVLSEVEVVLGDGSIKMLKMQSPLVSAWVLNDEFLQPISIFDTNSRETDTPVFIGEWNGIHYGQTVPLKYPHLGLERSKKETPGLLVHYQPAIEHHDNSRSTALVVTTQNFPIGLVGYWNTSITSALIEEDEEEDDEEEEEEEPTMFDMAIWYPWEMFISTLLLGVVVAYIIYRITMRRRRPNLVSEGTNPEHDESVSTTSLQFSPRSSNGIMEFEFPSLKIFVSRFEEDFEYIKEIGKGGFGRVVEAKHKLSDQNYAIKIIKLPLKEESQKKVQREVQALAKLEHPHILRYYSSWEETPPIGWMRQRRYTSTSAESFDSGTSTSPAFLRSPRTPSKVNSPAFFSESSVPNDNSLTFDNTDTSGGIVFKNNSLTFDNTDTSDGIIFKNNSFNLLPFRRSPSFDSDDNKSTEDDSMIIFRDQSITQDNNITAPTIDRLNSKRSNLVLPLHRKMIDRTNSSNISPISGSVRISVLDTPEENPDMAKSVTFSSWEGDSGTTSDRKKSYAIDISDDGIDIDQSKDQTEDSAIVVNHGKQSYLYIQMEICHPDSLKHWLNNTNDRSSVMGIFKQIISAVEFIHSQNTIHRDIKPSNILFAMDGKVKVADFGLATVMGNINTGSLNTNVGEYTGPSMTHNLGTTLYMSPELEMECKTYDFKVDIYALGVVFFELLTVFDTAMERVDLILELKKQSLPKSFANNHPRYKPILLSMVDPDPKKRPTAPELSLMIKNDELCIDYTYSMNTAA